jgi:hypothetical protein
MMFEYQISWDTLVYIKLSQWGWASAYITDKSHCKLISNWAIGSAFDFSNNQQVWHIDKFTV